MPSSERGVVTDEPRITNHESRITVFVVDDHDVVRKGLRYFLSVRPEIAIVGEAGDAESAVDGVAEHVPDVVLMDLVLPLRPGTDPVDQGGVQATRLIRQASPHTQVVVLTSFAHDELSPTCHDIGTGKPRRRDDERIHAR